MAHIIFAKKVFTGETVLNDQLITCNNDYIERIESFTGQHYNRTCECIAPGFIDIHINGGKWNNFSKSPTIETLQDMETACLEQGTVFTLPTLITSPTENIFAAIEAVKTYRHSFPQTGIIGMHLEGPFLHPIKRGAHVKALLQTPADDLIEKIISEGREVITMITIAPEIFSDKQMRMLIDSGINVSVGHSNATYSQANHAFDMGAQLVTHLYNAMSSFMHRAPGLVGAAFDHAGVYTPVIMDGHHCDFAAARIAYKIKKDKFFLISDALFVGEEVKEFAWGEYDAKLEDGKYVNSEGNLTGAVISMGDGVRAAIRELGVSLQEAIEMATVRPARALRIDDRFGKIEINYPARFTIFDEHCTSFESLV